MGSRPEGAGPGGARHVEAFLEMMAAERGAAANTLDAYRRDLENFGEFLTALGLAEHEADARALRDYVAWMRCQGLAARTAARRLSTLRQFHRFLLREGMRADDPTALLDAPRLPRTPVIQSMAFMEDSGDSSPTMISPLLTHGSKMLPSPESFAQYSVASR